jgi:UDP-glucose 4-epimerase
MGVNKSKDMTLITGVGGFIASQVARRFISEGYNVVGVDDFSGGKRENVPLGVDLIEGDLAEEKTIKKLPKSCGLILHLAGQSSGEMSFDNPALDLKKNSVTTLNLINYSINCEVRKFLYASSVSIYDSVGDRPLVENDSANPSSCYGVSKLAAEGYLRIYSNQLPYVNMRMFNVYGPGQDLENLRQGMVSIYLAQAVRGGNIHIKGSLDRFRDYIYIDDVVEAWFRASTFADVKNISLNIGTGVKTTVRQLLELIKKEIPATKWNVEGFTLGDQFGHYSNNSLMKEKLHIEKFTSLHDGIKNFSKWAIQA